MWHLRLSWIASALVACGFTVSASEAAAQSCWVYYADVNHTGRYEPSAKFPTYKLAYDMATQAKLLGSRVSYIVNVCTGQVIPYPDAPVEKIRRPSAEYVNQIKDAYRRAKEFRQEAISRTTSLTATQFKQVNNLIAEFNRDFQTAQRDYPGFAFGVQGVSSLVAEVQYRSRSNGLWLLYARYSTLSQAQAVAADLAKKHRNLEFRTVAR